MAIIPCPECGREISDRAKACIHCGFPISGSGPLDEGPVTGAQVEASDAQELRRALNHYMHEYNTYRPHSSIDGCCPDEAYYGAIWVAA